ncbi:MAG: hypothetical protein V3T49_03565, partial [Dehalococcoidia bacterium]
MYFIYRRLKACIRIRKCGTQRSKPFISTKTKYTATIRTGTYRHPDLVGGISGDGDVTAVHPHGMVHCWSMTGYINVLDP